MSSDRLVELFVQSSRPEADYGSLQGWDGRPLDAEAIERGVDTMEKMLSSEDAIRMGGSAASTFVCLAMALEEKPKLQAGAIRCYEKALQHLPRLEAKGGNWERITVLQQLGMVCLRQSRPKEAQKWLSECSEACAKAAGHPRDAVIFGGDFKTKQTRSEFLGVVEKLRAKTCLELGDQAGARFHMAEVQRVEAAASGDAVERCAVDPTARPGGPSPAQPAAGRAPQDPVKELWAAEPKEERRLKEYSYVDEGPTVMVMLDLNEHLGIGSEASAAVDSLRQFRVLCQEFSADVRLRLRRADGSIWQFQLLLSPLAREIVPEDTVPRLRGKEGKRRLEVRLFKRDKQEKWFGDLVAEGLSQKKRAAEAAKSKQGPVAKTAPEANAEKGTLLNPLSAEELARLPRPSGGASADNRPSSWRQAGSQLEQVPAPAVAPAAAPVPEARPRAAEPSAPGAAAAAVEAAGVSLEDMD